MTWEPDKNVSFDSKEKTGSGETLTRTRLGLFPAENEIREKLFGKPRIGRFSAPTAELSRTAHHLSSAPSSAAAANLRRGDKYKNNR